MLIAFSYVVAQSLQLCDILSLPRALHSNLGFLQAVVDVWRLFQAEFLQLWDELGHKGDAYPAVLFGEAVHQGQQAHQASTLG